MVFTLSKILKLCGGLICNTHIPTNMAVFASVFFPGEGGTQIWFGQGCVTRVSNPLPIFNPRLPQVFYVTHLPKGGWLPPPLWTWDWHAQSMSVWYHSIGEDLLFPLIPKFWKSANVWRHNDVFKHGRPEKADFQGNIGQNWIFAKKSSKYRNFTRFFAYKGGKWCF